MSRFPVRKLLSRLSKRAKAKRASTSRLRIERLESRLTPTGTYTGTVFQDFNYNGVRDTASTISNTSGTGSVPVAVDRGLAGITVQAFDAGNVLQRHDTPANGFFTFTPNGTALSLRVYEPAAGFSWSNRANSHSTVQFAPDGGAANLDAGLVCRKTTARTIRS